MRVFLLLLVLILSVQSWTKADDIKDFEIEGLSIDSLLNFASKKKSNLQYQVISIQIINILFTWLINL